MLVVPKVQRPIKPQRGRWQCSSAGLRAPINAARTRAPPCLRPQGSGVQAAAAKQAPAEASTQRR
eukprot:1053378-Pyramimonas_sp.AAC.1